MIRQAKMKDLPAIVSLEQELFPQDPWDMRSFRYEMEENPYGNLAVMDTENGIIGFIDWWIMYENAEIADIGVSKAYQEKGCGQQLLTYAIQKAIEKNCENVSLEVRISNTPAISLYEKNGFIQASRRRNYYSDGEDAWLMVKPIGGLNDKTSGN